MTSVAVWRVAAEHACPNRRDKPGSHKMLLDDNCTDCIVLVVLFVLCGA